MGKYHFNTETMLGLAYIVACVVVIGIVAAPIPASLKKKVNTALSQLVYYLMVGSLLPVYIAFNAFRTLQRLAESFPESPKGHDKHKGKVIKQQRNLLIGAFGLTLFLILFRFHKMLGGSVGVEEDNKVEIKKDVMPAGDVSIRDKKKL